MISEGGLPAGSGGRLSAGVLCGVAAALGAFVYLNALNNPFVYDDHRVIVENPSLLRLGDLTAIVAHDVKRPIANLSYAVDVAVWGVRPFGFHLTSLALHLLNIVLVFVLASQIAEDATDPEGDTTPHRAAPLAFAAAALFAVHPLMTQAVGYISARADVLCATFMLLTLLCYRAAVVRHSSWWLAASGLTTLLAIGTKETAAVLPLLTIAYDWLGLSDHRARFRQRALRVLLPALLLTIAIGAARLALLVRVEYSAGPGVQWSYALVEADVLRQYLKLLALPVGQSVFHPVTAIASLTDRRALFAIAWVVSLMLVTWRLAVRDWLAAYGVLWFLLTLVPSAVLVMFDLGEPMAEHRVYIASIGLFLAAGCAFGWLWSWARRRWMVWRVAIATAMALVLVVLSLLTVRRNAIWGNPVRLWVEAAMNAPDIWVTHLMLGQELQLQGRLNEAVYAYRRAIALRPQEPYGYTKAAECLIALQRYDEAGELFKQWRAVDHRSNRPVMGLGLVAALTGRPAEAQKYFEEAIAIDPTDRDSRESLARLNANELPRCADCFDRPPAMRPGSRTGTVVPPPSR